MSDNIIYSTTQVLNLIASIIQRAFDPQHCKIGQLMNYDTILDDIYTINGIQRVRTVYYPADYLSTSNRAIYD